MAIYRLSIHCNPEKTSEENVRKMCIEIRNWLLPKVPNYCDVFEKNEKDNGVHFHACFPSFDNKGKEILEERLKKIVRTHMSEQQCAFLKNGKGGFNLTNKKKGCTMTFVGYNYKESDEIYAKGEWEDIDSYRDAYFEALEDAKIGHWKFFCMGRKLYNEIKESGKITTKCNNIENWHSDSVNIMHHIVEPILDNGIGGKIEKGELRMAIFLLEKKYK